jgi:type IV secretion system protein TrbJ
MKLARNVYRSAAQAALVLLVGAGLLAATPARAGIPVIDGANLSQNLMTAFESVEQTLKQIQQYQTQLQQYENMLQNTAAPAAYIWDRANSIITRLTDATNTLNYYKQRAGSIDGYLSKFQNVNYYRGSPCFKGGGCTAAEERAVKDTHTLGSDAIKRSNDAVFRGLDQQQNQLQSDANQLVLLQSKAQGAEGQMAAIQYGNQLASNQATQLLQVRGMLIAQQQAEATRAQVAADRDAQQQAAHEASVDGNRIAPTPSPKKW